jgi:hypothetical protein
MVRLAVSCAACTVVLFLRVSLGACQVEADQSPKIIDELASHLPKGAILFGKDLPATVKRAVKELVALSRERQTVEDLTARSSASKSLSPFR